MAWKILGFFTIPDPASPGQGFGETSISPWEKIMLFQWSGLSIKDRLD